VNIKVSERLVSLYEHCILDCVARDLATSSSKSDCDFIFTGHVPGVASTQFSPCNDH
jgi:hypothetical protein